MTQHTIKPWLLRGAGICALGAGIAHAAIAQDAASTADENLFVLETIVVTAERRSQSSQDVPIAVTVLSASDIENKGIDNVDDIQRFAPSLAINAVGRSTFINIRGVGIAQSAPTSVPGVAFYIDGLSIPHEQTIAASFFDIGSIEVLRGPQGTLTGQNSTGGAIYVTTPAPIHDENFAKVNLDAGNYGVLRGTVAANLGLSDNIAIRAAYTHNEQGSFSENLGTGDEVGNRNLDAARINIALKSDDDKFSTNIRAEYLNNKTGNEVVKRPDDTNTNPFEINQDAVSYQDFEGFRVSIEPRWEFMDGVELRAHVSYQDMEMVDHNDGDRTSTAAPIPIGLPATGGNRAIYPGRVSEAYNDLESFIAEVNLISTGDGPFNWVFGGFYMDDSNDVQLYRDNHNVIEFENFDSIIDVKTENISKSVFGQINWFMQEKLEFILGARYSDDTQKFPRTTLPGPPLPVVPFVGTPATSGELTGKVGLNYFVSDDAMVYAIVSKGYKAGGVNLLPFHGNFGPEKNYVYELGFKSELLDNTLRLNGSAYYSDYQDFQLLSGSGGFPLVENAASVEIMGLELEGLALFGKTSINFGLGYMHGEFATDACLNNSNGNTAHPDCPAATTFVPKGDASPYAPDWTINVGVEHEFELANDMLLTPRVQVSHISEQYSSPFIHSRSIIDARTVVDARVRMLLSNGVTLEAYVDNLFDETYIASQRNDSTSALGGYVYGAPRHFGIRASFEFGS